MKKKQSDKSGFWKRQKNKLNRLKHAQQPGKRKKFYTACGALTGVGVALDAGLMLVGVPPGLATIMLGGPAVLMGAIVGGVVEADGIAKSIQKDEWRNEAGQQIKGSRLSHIFTDRAQTKINELAYKSDLDEVARQKETQEIIEQTRELTDDIEILDAGPRGASASEYEFVIPFKEVHEEWRKVTVVERKNRLADTAPVKKEKPQSPKKLGL